MQARDKKRYYLRINVEPGGCHGFQYFMALTEKKREDDFDAKVVVDKESLNLIEGSTLDYAEELIGSAFKLVKNPNATSDCGCGSSFDVKD
ncbi:FeS cluster biogenesis domain-containing protein [Rozella allomycis CSF55]|uniref:FeS cluster biogenesis domain-containing protein n=1 Tax=Rozella allomycis (strain CSF55) TaxID=988480 RepID=A0A075B0Q7_ROZAC|nr:FeS cluster biogenesis domain-containing protein [Rozella allomycis CSF55]|eukprot:EPZ36124.1 FeS cluster biogenesis domain-containing protein [Rozella allomycis CSF55]